MAGIKLGWIPFNERTSEQDVQHEQAVRRMPKFTIYRTRITEDIKRVNLYDVWYDPKVVAAFGYKFPRFHQLTGSCVGVGLGDTVFTLSAIEILRLQDPEQLIIPFWPFNYGMSRKRAGMRGQGEGSLGSTGAESAKLDGFLRADTEGLPKILNKDGLEYTESIEMQWSDGYAIDRRWNTMAQSHIIKTVSPVTSAADARLALLNKYPLTIAYDYFVGKARIDQDVLVGKLDSRGGHQTSLLAWWNHPRLGELFLYQNQWPASIYPKDPAGAPACSCWIPKSDVETICKQGEAYAYSQFEGFPSQELSWDF